MSLGGAQTSKKKIFCTEVLKAFTEEPVKLTAGNVWVVNLWTGAGTALYW